MRRREIGDFVFQVPVEEPFSRSKVGRNDPCPCGSGKKFKKCHLDKPPVPISVVPPEVVEETHHRFRLHQERLQNHSKRHGHVREPVHTMFQGRRFVVVGSSIHYSNPERPWRTFHDFLMEYVTAKFGREWGTTEQAKAKDERHPAFQMFEGWWTFKRQHHNDADVDGIIQAPWTGSVASLATLAYDLFTVGDNAQLQDRLIRRLRHADQYQGARYELFAIATCVRGGFSVAYEDEDDGSKKHPELIATHKKTGLQVAVEAKSRHRPGVLGFKTATQPSRDDAKARVRSVLINALKKEPCKPYVIFVDVNLPGSSPLEWFTEIGQETLPSIPAELLRRANLVLCTNVTFHRTPDGIPDPTTFFTAHEPANPFYPVDRALLDELAKAAGLFGNVPHSFPDSNA